MKKLNQFYCRLDEKGEHLETNGYIFTYGYGANGIGGRDYIRLDHIIDNMRIEVNRYLESIKKHDEILKDWEQDKTHNEYYSKEDKKLNTLENNLYKYYYESVFAVLTKDEIDQIQKKINYDFMSEKFINETINYLENEKLERVA